MFVIHYDDFNPFLDRFRDRLGSRNRRADKVLAQWKLWDHMDAILSLGVTGLVDRILEVRQPSAVGRLRHLDAKHIDELDRHQARDLLLLAACYDQSTAETFKGRWHRLRRRLKFQHAGSRTGNWRLGWTWMALLADCCSLLLLGERPRRLDLAAVVAIRSSACSAGFPGSGRAWKTFWLARGILQRMRVGIRETNPLRQVLMQFTPAELSGQPLPNKDSTDDRYELLLQVPRPAAARSATAASSCWSIASTSRT